MTTRWSDAVTYLIAAWQAAPALSGVPVYDGISPQTGSDPQFVIVGHDGTLEADGTLTPDALAGQFAQQWLEFDQAQPRQETGQVQCLLTCQSGDPAALTDLRIAAGGLLADLEAAMLASGGEPVTGMNGLTFDGTSGGRWVYRQSLSGAAVMTGFTVTYSTAW